VTLAAIVIFNIIGQFGQRIFYSLDEAETAGGATAEAYDSVAFGEIVGYGKDFAIFGKAISCAFQSFGRRFGRISSIKPRLPVWI